MTSTRLRTCVVNKHLCRCSFICLSLVTWDLTHKKILGGGCCLIIRVPVLKEKLNLQRLMFLALEICAALQWIFCHLTHSLLGASRKHLWKNMQLLLKCGSWARVTCVRSPGTACCRAASHIRYAVAALSLLAFEHMDSECLLTRHFLGAGISDDGDRQGLCHVLGENPGEETWIFLVARSPFPDFYSNVTSLEAFPDHPFFNRHTYLPLSIYSILHNITDVVTCSYVFFCLSLWNVSSMRAEAILFSIISLGPE